MNILNQIKDGIEDKIKTPNIKRNFVLIFVIIFFILWFLKRNLIIFFAFGAVLIVFSKFYKVSDNNDETTNKTENFDQEGIEFVPKGQQRFDLLGRPIETRPAERHRSKDRCCCTKF